MLRSAPTSASSGAAQTGLDVRHGDAELARAERGGGGGVSELTAPEACDHLRVEGFCAQASLRAALS